MIEADENLNIKMIEKDYGLKLPIQLETDVLGNEDKFVIKIFKRINEKPIIVKEYENIKENTIEFELTKEESELLKVGRYFYDLDWFQENLFLGNIIAKKKIIIEEKAGI